ncbi:helix-turn-helix domain-containing protein [Chryseobacterium oranimense]|uniref:helix-turn-helix domain-containing protein n=1 Tax=Chryseobacterium oranimense TaxID=421058 RepID=UPI0021AF2675|nr:helix-turn-helix domain-containing protein [Chryseobacterium oranimense]UWX61770.1 helix-turn-helix domain-containing protein [Chryseobacterium oranimense]
MKNHPNYKNIYSDIVSKKFPHKQKECETLLKMDSLSFLNIIELNKIIFGVSDIQTENFNQKHRSYQKSDILKILDYQKKNKLNNIQLANHFKLSRNTVTKWKKMFLVK